MTLEEERMIVAENIRLRKAMAEGIAALNKAASDDDRMINARREAFDAAGKMRRALESKPLKANDRLITAAPDVLAALKMLWGFVEDLSKSNPGYLANLTLQDYEQWNEAMIKAPRAIAKAEKRS